MAEGFGEHGFTVVENQSLWEGQANTICCTEACVFSQLVDQNGVNHAVQGDLSLVTWPINHVLRGNFTRIATISGRYVVYNADPSVNWAL